jgi:aminopeptidase N
VKSVAKIIFHFVFLFSTVFISAQRNIDVLHYKFEIELSDNSDTIKGKAFVELKFLENTNKFFLNLTSHIFKGKGMIAYRVLRKDEAVSSTHGNDSLYISLSSPATKDEVRTYEIFYEGIPSDGLIISKNKYGERTFFADNWPNRAHNWIPCIDDPSDKASFEFIVTAPSHYRVISNGILTEETNLANNKKLTHWKEDIPLPTKVMVIGAADFAVNQFPDSPDNIPVSAWVYQRDSINGFIDYAPATAILKFLSNYIGPYPYKKLANVESKTIFGGMENAGAIFYSENTVTGNSEDESLMAHEITHQWFGDMVTEKSFAHLWLSEGFATYFAHIYIESKYGTDSLNKEMQKDRDDVIEFAKAWNKPVVDSVSPYMRLLNVNSYQKGSWVLHMLRRQLGDSVFHQIIRSYYDIYKGKNADTKDFENIAEKISGKSLAIFFRQWLYMPGLPNLKISWKYRSKEKQVSIKVDQVQTGLFQFPLDISVINTKSKIEKLIVSKRSETFIFPLKEKPLKLLADPFTSLLFDGTIVQLK